MRNFTKSAVLLLFTASMSGCATIFGGPVTEYQRKKPLPGQPQREVRAGALIADILLFWPGTFVDFATGAIYKPEFKAGSPVKTEPASTTSESKTENKEQK